tara:strand:- start:547 stop:1197 length:651 start_codon:yes stop_codon:yes gene_type:complete
MKLIGAPDEWIGLIDNMVPDILDLVLSTWEAMPQLAPDAREDPTTEELCRGLRQNRNSNNLPFRIDIQSVELDPAVGEGQGRMDITFSPPVPREDIYFCLECKRLNVVYDGQVRPLASEYVTHGLMRFIRGQYARQIKHGGMLGYVLDGKMAKAMKGVSGVIKKRFEELGMEQPGDMLPSSIRPENSNVRETYHARRGKAGNIKIHHIFVGGASTA